MNLAEILGGNGRKGSRDITNDLTFIPETITNEQRLEIAEKLAARLDDLAREYGVRVNIESSAAQAKISVYTDGADLKITHVLPFIIASDDDLKNRSNQEKAA